LSAQRPQAGLDEHLAYYDFDRAQAGRLINGPVPGEIVYGARKMGAVRSRAVILE
jgi:hypothetical protein